MVSRGHDGASGRSCDMRGDEARKHGVLFVALILVAGLLLMGILGCSQRKTVTRIESDTTVDLSGRWNDTDSRMVAESMIMDSLNHPWLTEFVTEKGGKPAVIIGAVRNRSTEHIAIDTFLKDIERAFINSGRIKVVARAQERQDLRAEKDDQAQFALEQTIKQQGRELGADLMLMGSIDSIPDQEGGTKAIFYQVDLTLTDIETNVKVWTGQHEIKKVIQRSRFSP